MAKYKWNPAFRGASKAKAEMVGAEIEALLEEAGGELTPGQIIKAAREPESAMHPLFEWNDTAAAQQYRLEQARLLLRSVTVSVETNDGARTVRAFVTYTPADAPEGSREVYTGVEMARADSKIADQIIERAWDELLAWKARYDKYKDVFGPVFEGIEVAREAATEAVPA
jgi:hypothetical protein